MEIDVNQITVEVRLLKGEKILATAVLKYGPFVWKGFRITEGIYSNELGNKLWVQPPSFKSPEGKYLDLFFCEDLPLWNNIKKKIILKYGEVKDKIAQKESEEITEKDYDKIDKAGI